MRRLSLAVALLLPLSGGCGEEQQAVSESAPRSDVFLPISEGTVCTHARFDFSSLVIGNSVEDCEANRPWFEGNMYSYADGRCRDMGYIAGPCNENLSSGECQMRPTGFAGAELHMSHGCLRLERNQGPAD
jgi:hypothetical protein